METEELAEESFYDDVEIEDMTYDAKLQLYHFPCPCGDRFEISLGDLRDGEEVATCPSCSLMIRVIFDADDLPKPDEAEVDTKKEVDEQKDLSTQKQPQQPLAAPVAA